MIYHLIKPVIKIALFFFFKKVVVIGKSNIPKKGPLIIVANHPNTLIDPLIIASITKQRIGFIANAGIFKNKLLSKILNYLHIIPIYRKKDVASGEKPNNENTFIRCHEYLEKGQTFLIFPEGSSYYELKLREIKTGTARIALSFEALSDFKGDLKIVPIALDYEDSIQFRSLISVTVNPPIAVRDYKQTYLNNKSVGVSELTETIRKELAKNIPHTSGKDQEEFLIKIHMFYTTYFDPKAAIHVDAKQSLQLRNKVSNAMNYIKDNDFDLYQAIQNKVNLFFNLLKATQLSLGFFTDTFIQRNKFLLLFNYVLKFIFLFPFNIIGLVTNYVPYILPYRIFKSLKVAIEYKTSIQLIAGLVLFPIFYLVEILIFRKFISNELWISLILPFIFIITGFVAMFYWIALKRAAKVVKFYFFTKKSKKVEILKLRDEIISDIELAEINLSIMN